MDKIDKGVKVIDDLGGGNSLNAYLYNPTTQKINMIKSSDQIPAGLTTGSSFTNNKVVMPDSSYNGHFLRWLAANVGTHRRAIELKANLVAGLGFDVMNKSHRNYPKLEKFLKTPNENFGDNVFKQVVNLLRFKYIYGPSYWEIKKVFERAFTYAIKSTENIFVIPKYNSKNHATNTIDKYIQVANNGESDVIFNVYDGKPKLGISYLFRFGYKTSSSSFYPEPEYVAEIGGMLESHKIDIVNQAYWDNGARPGMMIIFTGKKMTDAEREKMETDFKTVKGSENVNKTMLLEHKGQTDNVQVVDLVKHEDGQFTTRQQYLDYRIARSHGLMGSIMGLMSGGAGLQGGSVAIGDLFLLNQTFIRQEMQETEGDLNLVFESLFGFNPDVRMRSIDNINQKEMAVIASLLKDIVGLDETRKWLDKHGVMELDLTKIPKDIISKLVSEYVTKEVVTGTTIDGEQKPEETTDSTPDGITTIDEDKFAGKKS